ncbi:MAG: hypothetical protein FWB74_07650 [Defluviitaleaceae bacterium]|nr:hypothetical protein [Defluviitaleaceae bacterium]
MATSTSSDYFRLYNNVTAGDIDNLLDKMKIGVVDDNRLETLKHRVAYLEGAMGVLHTFRSYTLEDNVEDYENEYALVKEMFAERKWKEHVVHANS